MSEHTIAVKVVQEEIFAPRRDPESGECRAVATGKSRAMYHVLIDGEVYATTPSREAAERTAAERAFMADLARGDAAAAGAIALYFRGGAR